MSRLILAFCLFFPVFSVAQDLNCVVTVSVNQKEMDPFFGTPTGIVFEARATGTVIGKKEDSGEGYLGYILTAEHVANSNTFNIRCDFSCGKQSKDGKFLGSDKNSDISIILAWVPKETPIAPIFDGDLIKGSEAYLVGKPDKLREYRAPLLRIYSGKVYFDTTVSPGDSGGPIFVGDKLAGVISGGWFWIEPQEKELPETWPAHGGGPLAIRKLFDSVRQ